MPEQPHEFPPDAAITPALSRAKGRLWSLWGPHCQPERVAPGLEDGGQRPQ